MRRKHVYRNTKNLFIKINHQIYRLKLYFDVTLIIELTKLKKVSQLNANTHYSHHFQKMHVMFDLSVRVIKKYNFEFSQAKSCLNLAKS